MGSRTTVLQPCRSLFSIPLQPVPPQNLVDRAMIDVSALRARSPTPMLHLLYALLTAARSSLRSKRGLALESLALRQQLAVLRHKTKRPKLTNTDRAFWVTLSRLWSDWQHALILVKPETVIRWHRKGFKLCAELPDPRPRQDLWRGLRSSPACDGNRAGPDGASLSVAESVL